MKNNIPAFLLQSATSDTNSFGRGRVKTSFIDKGIHHAAQIIQTGYVQWESASKDNLFQGIDARIKVITLLFYIIIVSLKKDIMSEALIGVFVFILTIIGRLNVLSFYKRVIFFSFIFGFIAALPSAFNIIISGEIIFPIIHLSKAHHIWIYQIPKDIGLTSVGITAVTMLTLRCMNSMSLTLFVLSTTTFPEIIKALKVMRVPDAVLMIITLSYKYIFIFAKIVEDMHLAKKSRLIEQLSLAEGRSWVSGRIAYIFKKTTLRCEEIIKAMLSRGFSDNIKIYGLKKLCARDWTTGAIFLIIGIVFLWI
jgi:cobalt ECF transporter T component CbiQ